MARHRSTTSVRRSSTPTAAPLAAAPRPADIRLTLPARPENIVVVRQALTAVAQALGLPAAIVDDLRLAVTEACTNVVRHAYQDGEGPIDVTVRPDDDTLLIIVADRGRGMAPSEDQRGPGLGLGLIAALSDELQVRHAPGDGAQLTMTFSRAAHTAEDDLR